jgi:hypothetical protein
VLNFLKLIDQYQRYQRAQQGAVPTQEARPSLPTLDNILTSEGTRASRQPADSQVEPTPEEAQRFFHDLKIQKFFGEFLGPKPAY